ncbi:MAG: crossover junction endodeoxyribonuclease RuvC [Candidatus Hydrogenedentota bacterium]
MRVLGIDPGTATTGFGVVEGQGNRLLHQAHGVISTPAKTPFADRLCLLYDGVCELLDVHKPDAVSIEKLYFSQNVTTGIGVAQARGVIALAVAQAGLPIAEFSPLEVKNAVVGYGKAAKGQVQDMVRILLNLDARPKPDDAADGLALAICLIHAGRIRLALGE